MVVQGEEDTSRKRGAATAVLAILLSVAVIGYSLPSQTVPSELEIRDDGIPDAKGTNAELESYANLLSFGPGIDPASNPSSHYTVKVRVSEHLNYAGVGGEGMD